MHINPEDLAHEIFWDDIVKKEFPGEHFLINPYVPKTGRVLFWGDTGSAKSPTTWEISRCIGAGAPFMGLPTEQARVLFIEMDSTERGTAARLKLHKNPPPPSNVAFLFPGPLNIPNVQKSQEKSIMDAMNRVRPGLVIVNNLLWCHDMDDKESKTVKAVYGWFEQILGKDLAILFVHHERKSPADPRFHDSGKEKFSGAKNWLNNAQVGLQITEHEEGSITHRLWHHKSQESAPFRPLGLRLAPDGTNFSCPKWDDIQKVKSFIDSHPKMPKRQVDLMLKMELKCSERKIQSFRGALSDPGFPLPETWIGRAKNLTPKEAKSVSDSEDESSLLQAFSDNDPSEDL